MTDAAHQRAATEFKGVGMIDDADDDGEEVEEVVEHVPKTQEEVDS